MQNNLLRRSLVLILLFLIVASSFVSFTTGSVVKYKDSNFEKETYASIENIHGIKYDPDQFCINNYLIKDNPNQANILQGRYGMIDPIWIANQSYQEWYRSIEVYGDYIYAAGYSWDKETDTYFAIFGKYDFNDGSQIWMKNWSTNYTDTQASFLDVYKDEIYVTGRTYDTRAKYSFIYKFDLDGNLIWSKLINETISNTAGGIKLHEDFIYVCGKKDFAACLWKYDTNGEKLWSERYEIPGTAVSALYDLDIYNGYIYADGSTDSLDESKQDLLIVKIDLNGELQWYTEWGGEGLEIGAFMDVGDDGFIYIAGCGSEDFEHVNDYIWKCDLNGNIKWVTTTSLESVLGDVVFWNGDVYVIGEDRTAYKDALLVKVDDQGNLIWYLTWKSEDNFSYAGGFTMDEYEDYFYLCGSNMGAGFLMKYDVTLYSDNNKPNTPSKPSGPQSGVPGERYYFESVATDPDDDLISYYFSWGDRRYSRCYWENSGENRERSHRWTERGIYSVRVRVRDEHGFVSDWSDPLEVTMPRNKIRSNLLFYRFLEQFPIIQKIFNFLNI